MKQEYCFCGMKFEKGEPCPICNQCKNCCNCFEFPKLKELMDKYKTDNLGSKDFHWFMKFIKLFMEFMITFDRWQYGSFDADSFHKHLEDLSKLAKKIKESGILNE